jgi:hypothetical protein
VGLFACYSHSHRGFSPVIELFHLSPNRFNGLERAGCLVGERKPLKRLQVSEFAITPG